jgi:hypothetical protein
VNLGGLVKTIAPELDPGRVGLSHQLIKRHLWPAARLILHAICRKHDVFGLALMQLRIQRREPMADFERSQMGCHRIQIGAA